MGKGWDHGIPGVPYWSEALRVVNPGAFLLAFGGTRTFHRLACAIEDAGWEIRDAVMWVYGSGFPKSLDVSKAIDKVMGAERMIIGVSPKQPAGFIRRGRTDEEVFSGVNIQRIPETITAPATPESKQWEGWGTALKPAWEPIIVARKPLEGTVAENALKWGCGGINIDGCRVGFVNEADRKESVDKNQHADFNSNDGIKVPTKGIYHGDFRPPENYNPVKGRFPANLIHDGSDEVMELFPNVKSGGMICKTDCGNSIFGKRKVNTIMNTGDSGSAARFFKKCELSKEDLCELVNTAEGNLNQQKQVEDFVLKLVAIEGDQEDSVSSDLIRPFMNEMRKRLRNDSENNMQPILNIGGKCLQELKHIIMEMLSHNHVKSAEIQKRINIMMTMESLLNIDGFVEVVMSDTMLNNMVLGGVDYQPRFKYCAKASKAERDAGCEEMEERQQDTSRKQGNPRNRGVHKRTNNLH